MPEALRIETLSGPAAAPLLPHIARLRTAVFRSWPYLYDGDADYEQTYLRTYISSPRAAVVVAFAADAPVGAATCIPLEDETENVRAPFRARGWDAARFFYFGESVLLPEHRGSGIGVKFFEAREAHARSMSACDYACFCAVVRPADHPAKPSGAVPLDEFWRHRGYTPRPDLRCSMSWKEIGRAEETDHELSFWIKSLTGAALP